MKKVIIIAFLLVLIAVGSPMADTIALPNDPDSVSDTFIWPYLSDTNYGDYNYLMARYGNNPAYEYFSLIQFDLSSLSGLQITSAELSLYHYMADAANETLEVSTVTSSWNEMTVTWNTGPTVGTLVDSLTIPDSSTGQWRTFDVTSAVQGWVSGDNTNYGLAIQTTNNEAGSPYLVSSDTTNTALRPTLIVETAVVPEPVSSILFVTGAAILGFRRFKKTA